MTTPEPSPRSPTAVRVLKKLSDENRRLRADLVKIRCFGYEHPGYGFACARMAGIALGLDKTFD